MADTSLASLLGAINTSNLTKGYSGYGQSFGQYTDPTGKVYIPTYGGELNTPISYGSTIDIGGDTVNVQYDASGNVISATGQPVTVDGKQYVRDYSPTGKVSYREYAGPNSTLQDLAPVIGMAATAFGLPGLIGGALAPGASAAVQAAIGGAATGGGLAGLTGQDVLKGALLGGAAGYAGSSLGDYLNSTGALDTNGWDMASAANYDAGLQGVGNNFGGLSDLQLAQMYDQGLFGVGANISSLDAQTLARLYDEGLIGVGSNVGTDFSLAQAYDQGLTGVGDNLTTNTAGTELTGGKSDLDLAKAYDEGLTNVGNNAGTTVTGSTASLAQELLKAGVKLLPGLLTAGGVNKVINPSTKTTPSTSGAQVIPSNNADYYNAIQQYYNAYLPGAPKDVASPLANWYSTTYGGAPVTGTSNLIPTSQTTTVTNPTTKTVVNTMTPQLAASLIQNNKTTADTVQQILNMTAAQKAGVYNTAINSGLSDADILSKVNSQIGQQTNMDWNILQGLAAAQALQSGNASPAQIENIRNLEVIDKALTYNNLLGAGLTDADVRKLVETQMGSQTDSDWNYLQNAAKVAEVSKSTDPLVKAQEYNTLLSQGYTDSQIRNLAESVAGSQTDSDWAYLQQLAASI